MGAIPKLLFLFVFGIVLYINLLPFSFSRIHDLDTYRLNLLEEESDDLPEEIDNLNDVFNRTLGFQKIFAINLPERSDRRDSLSLAAAVSNISLEYIDAVRGDTVADAILPPSPHVVERPKENGAIGCWASHVKALTEIVNRNLTTALIIEDDIDWDIRLKPLLHDFAISSRSLASKVPLKGDLPFTDIPTYFPNPSNQNPNTTTPTPSFPPTHSPYGDDWSLLHLGHCGLQLSTSPRIIHYSDPSVPELRHLSGWNPNGTPLQIYPHHTRITTQGLSGVCLFAYAVSQSGARKLLREIGIEKYDLVDNAVKDFCDGMKDVKDGGKKGGKGERKGGHVCRGVIPQLFDTWRPAGGNWRDSDISKVGAGGNGEESVIRKEGGTANIRWSVRKNMERILYGRMDFEDQYPDSGV